MADDGPKYEDIEDALAVPGLEERRFKRELFLRLFPDRITDAAFCWMLVQIAWQAKPEDC